MKPSSYFLTVLIVSALLNCRTKVNDQSVPLLRIGLQQSPSNALLIICQQKRLYDSSRVRIELVPFEAGKLAYQDLLSNASTLDLAVAAETPFVLSVLNTNPNVRVVASIGRAVNESRLVVATNTPLSHVTEYFRAGKRKIATSIGGSPEYAYWRMMQDFNIPASTVEKVGMKPSDMPAAIGNGVDGIVVFDPPAFKAEKKLGNQAATFVNRQPILTFYNLYAHPTILSAQRQDPVQALCEGLLKTQEYIKQHPDEAQKIVATYTNIGKPIVQATWLNYNFAVMSPSSELKRLCQDETNWAVQTNKVTVTSVRKPNFAQYFDTTLVRQATRFRSTVLN